MRLTSAFRCGIGEYCGGIPLLVNERKVLFLRRAGLKGHFCGGILIRSSCLGIAVGLFQALVPMVLQLPGDVCCVGGGCVLPHRFRHRLALGSAASGKQTADQPAPPAHDLPLQRQQPIAGTNEKKGPLNSNDRTPLPAARECQRTAGAW